MREQLNTALEGRYEIQREIGRGGMATVFLAHDLRHDRDVAVKVLHPELGAVLGGDRFLSEIRTTARLQHPHILPLIDSGSVEGLLFYVMPFVEGESLRARLERERQLPVSEAVQIAREVADALAYAHKHDVIHRDIKPENILLHGGHALVADFGIALAASKTSGQRMTETGLSLGTPNYMSPEQAMGERNLDARSDIYALGCVLFEMLAGESPFTGPTAQAIVAKVITEGAPSVRTKRANVPENVDDAIATALEKLPADRFRTADEFAAALATGSTTSRRIAAVAPSTSRRQTVVLGALAVLASAGTFALGLSLARNIPAAPIAFARDTHVTWDLALEVTPSLSPDGKNVVYAAGTLTHLRIMTKPVDGGRAQYVTGDTTEGESNPQWSADGSRILFLSRGGVFSAPAGGGQPRSEIPASGLILSATWSPDGKRIAFSRGDTLYVREADAKTRALAAIREASLCTWSPTGEFIACSSGNSYYVEPGVLFANKAPMTIVLCRVSDGALTKVSDSTTLNASPNWSPDGQWLYFISDRDGPRDIYAQRIARNGTADGSPVRLSVGLNAHTISIAGNQGRLAYSRFNMRSSIWGMPLPNAGPVSSATATRLTNVNENIELFTPSPDGKWLYYDSNLSGNLDIFRVPIAGGEPEQLTTDPADDDAPTVSPDGKEFAFHSWRTGNRDVFVQRLDGGGVTQLTHTPKQEAIAEWSPDGKTIAFGNLSIENGFGLVHRDASGKWGEPIYRKVEGNRPVWAPDSRNVVLLSHAVGGGIKVAAADSGTPRMLVDLSPTGSRKIDFAQWSNSNVIHYVTHDAQGNLSIWSIPPTGGPSSEIVRMDPQLHPPNRGTFRIRGDRLYFLSQTRESDIWVMDVKHP